MVRSRTMQQVGTVRVSETPTEARSRTAITSVVGRVVGEARTSVLPATAAVIVAIGIPIIIAIVATK